MTEPQGPDEAGAKIDTALMQRRYGAGQPRPALLVITIGLLAALFVGWVVWAGIQQADQDVRWRTVGYSEVSSTSVTVDFDVFKPADADVICLVRALDDSSAEVGRAQVPITSRESDAYVVYTLQVTARPITAEVTDCQLDQ